jgi:hypothetical protein
MSKRKTVRKSKTVKKAATPPTPAQVANQLTWQLKGDLKNVQLSYLRVGRKLTLVRDKKMYSELGYADIESYAADRLQLGRASLYRYTQTYEWVSKSHPEWLLSKPKGFIPDLNDVADLISIEKQLEQKKLEPKKKAALEELKTKALDGNLRKGELDKLRRKGNKGKDSLRSFLSKVRLLRMRGSQLAGMPSEVISRFDSAIEILKNASVLQVAGLDLVWSGEQTATA